MALCKSCGTSIENIFWITEPKRQVDQEFCSIKCVKNTPRKCALCPNTFLPDSKFGNSLCLQHRLERQYRMFAGRR